MSMTTALENLINAVSYDELQFLLTQHQQRLHSHESFPPMNGGKAMQVFAKANGLANSHVLKAKMDEAGEARAHAPAPQDKVVVIAIAEKSSSYDDASNHTRFLYARDMDQAKEKLCDDIRNRAGELDRPADELTNVNFLVTPDEDDDVDLDDAEAVLDYIFEHNSIHDLGSYLEYLDYNLTTVLIDEHYL